MVSKRLPLPPRSRPLFLVRFEGWNLRIKSQGGLPEVMVWGRATMLTRSGVGRVPKPAFSRTTRSILCVRFKLIPRGDGRDLTCRHGLSDCEAHEKCRQGHAHLDGDHIGLACKGGEYSKNFDKILYSDGSVFDL